jgi:hypothetical protein
LLATEITMKFCTRARCCGHAEEASGLSRAPAHRRWWIRPPGHPARAGPPVSFRPRAKAKVRGGHRPFILAPLAYDCAWGWASVFADRAIAAAHYARDRKTEIRMITGKTCMASLALALAFSPLSGLQAAPLSGPNAQPLATGLMTTVAEKEKSMHHGKRHRHHHVVHSKGHKGCGGAYMYYSRKKHHCMDARNK